jgi:LmbE family N-acetylglucosaminyl deacetylase
MKAVCMVAHPDDCVIFGLGFILAHPEYTWHIVYLTYRLNTPRGKEMYDFWSRRGVTVDFLGFSDNKKDMLLNKLSFDPTMACNFIQTEIESADLVLTHGETGEYGHIHHKFVHECCRYHPHLVTFADSGDAYSVPSQSYTLQELPRHARSIAMFIDPHNHINYYDTSKL